MILHVTYLSRRDVGFIAAAATAFVDNTSERQATEKIDFISIGKNIPNLENTIL